jgi:hypothetical protein
MRPAGRALAAAVLAAAAASGPAASAAPEKEKAEHVVFVGPSDGPLAPTVEESFVGVKAALAPDAPAIELTREAPKKPHAWDEMFAALEKRGVSIVVAYVEDGETPLLEKAAEKSKLPLLVLSPEMTRPDLDPNRAVFWAGGFRPTDEALYALDFLLQPLSVHFPAIFHDGSARAAEAASKCARMHHVNQTPHPAAKLPADFGVADAKALAPPDAAADGTSAQSTLGKTDGILYFGGPAGAERIAAACAAAKVTFPVLFSQGLATRAVPTFASGAAEGAWALEPVYFEDYDQNRTGSPAPADLPALTAAAKSTGDHLYPATIRGFRAGRWVGEALKKPPDPNEKKSEKPEKRFAAALRSLSREAARGRPVFENWGHACLVRTEGWRSAKSREDPPCSRVNPNYMPMACTPQVGFFRPDRFAWDPGSYYVWMHWGKPEERTIEKDLAAIGLNQGGYEAELEARIIDDLMARTISRLNRLYLRNADGTAIPGVSFNVSFGTEKEPPGLKAGHRFEMVIRGDSDSTGGVAHGTSCEVFTTYLERTMYAKNALKPPLSVADRPYVTGAYKWGTSLPENLRGDTVRALCDGFTQAMSLTGAHECGHMFGLGHDEVTPRSIMNVVEAVGLDFDWGEWIPDNLKTLETRLGRVPAAKEK